jgi:hypothetical protein
MNNYAVLVTSAINTKFGVFTSEQRIKQTLATVTSIKHHIPGCKIYLLEMSGIPLKEDQKQILTNEVTGLLDFTGDPDVVGLYSSTENWDIVKNVTEVMCFNKALKTLWDSNQLNGIDRVFKVSGRYVLNDKFNIKFYEDYKNKTLIAIGAKKTSQFPYTVTLCRYQYMSRLWSWPTILTPEIIVAYDQILNYMYERLAAHGYADIEHCLYKFLDQAKLIEIPVLGLEGSIAPNGQLIKD